MDLRTNRPTFLEPPEAEIKDLTETPAGVSQRVMRELAKRTEQEAMRLVRPLSRELAHYGWQAHLDSFREQEAHRVGSEVLLSVGQHLKRNRALLQKLVTECPDVEPEMREAMELLHGQMINSPAQIYLVNRRRYIKNGPTERDC